MHKPINVKLMVTPETFENRIHECAPTGRWYISPAGWLMIEVKYSQAETSLTEKKVIKRWWGDRVVENPKTVTVKLNKTAFVDEDRLRIDVIHPINDCKNQVYPGLDDHPATEEILP